MGYAEELQLHEEMERAERLIGEARDALAQRIVASREAGDAAGQQTYEQQLAQVSADGRRLHADRAHRAAILTRYPELLKALQ